MRRNDVRIEDIPPPVLFSITDALIKPGKYDLDDMVFDASDMKNYTVHFTPERHMVTSNGKIVLLGDNIASS